MSDVERLRTDLAEAELWLEDVAAMSFAGADPARVKTARAEVVERCDELREQIAALSEPQQPGKGEAVTTYIRATHPYAFKAGEWAQGVGERERSGRRVWLLVWPDGATDEWVADDPHAGYEFSDADPSAPLSEKGQS